MSSAPAFQPRVPASSATPLELRKRSAQLQLWPLVAATFFMVSGGTYGTEDIIHGAGYLRGILILLITPLLWSLPTALMLGELSSAIPAEGGYYAWVRRAMGNFWGFQEAWLSLVASIFDMAIYPTLFVAYLTRLVPWFSSGHRGILVGVAVVAVCALLNIAGGCGSWARPLSGSSSCCRLRLRRFLFWRRSIEARSPAPPCPVPPAWVSSAGF